MITHTLPSDLFADHVLSQMSLRDLVRLDEAWPKALRSELYQQLFSRLPALPSIELFGRPSCMPWIKSRCLQVCTVDLSTLSSQALHQIEGCAAAVRSFILTCEDQGTLWRVLQEVAMKKGIRNKIAELQVTLNAAEQEDGLWESFCTFENLTRLIVSFSDVLTLLRVQQFLTASNSIRELKLIFTLEVSAVSTILRSSNAGCLIQLSLVYISMNDADLELVAQTCAQLLRFDLTGDRNAVVSESGLLSIARSLRKLTHVIVSVQCPVPNLLRTFLENCPDLHVVDIEGAVVDDAVLQTAGRCKGIRELTIGAWKVTTPAAIDNSMSLWQQLAKLEITLPEHSTAETAHLHRALANCTRLTSLVLYDLTTANAAVLNVLAAHCRQLEQVQLHGADNQQVVGAGKHLIALATNCRIMSKLSLTRITVTAQELQEMFKHLPKLHWLDLSLTGVLYDDAIVNAMRCCPRLWHVTNLFGPAITDQAVAALGNTHLMYVSLSSCYLVTEDALVQLVQRTGRLCHIAVPTALSLSQEARDRIRAAGWAVSEPAGSRQFSTETVLYRVIHG